MSSAAVFGCLALCFLTATSAVNSDVDGRPRLDPEKEEWVVEAGSSFKLRCQGKWPISWVLPAIFSEVPVSETRPEGIPHITKNYETNSSYPHITHLEIQKTNYLQTGFYRCVQNETKNLDDESMVASIYVYFKDDNNLLAVKEEHLPISVNNKGSVIIPCRPTDPNVTVTLENDSEPITVDGYEVTFDPKVGFRHSRPDLLGSQFVEVECRAVKGKLTSSRHLNVFVPSHTSEVAAPIIHAPHHALIDSELVLNCSANYEVAVQLVLNWSVPDSSGLETGRIVIGKLHSIMVNDEMVAVRNLTVKRVMASDEGFYECTVVDSSENQKQEKKYISVLDQNESYINLTVQGGIRNISIPLGTEYAKWVVYYTGHPEPQLIWYDPFGNEIATNNRYSVSTDSSSTILKVKEPMIEDTGNYLLVAKNFGTEKNESFHLDVKGPPEITFKLDTYYMVNQEADVNCSAVGNPLPRMGWSFHPCSLQPLDDCDIEDSDKFDESFYEEIRFGNQNKIDSLLKILATKSGTLRCSACTEKCVHKDLKFQVTDAPGGFHLSSPNVSVEGDTITMKCQASVYTHSKPLWYFDGHLLHTSDAFEISSNTSEFSYQTFLKINNVTKHLSGVYTCSSCELKSELKSDPCPLQNVMLNVTAMQKPTIIKHMSNLDGSEKDLVEKQSYTLKCYAHGLPRPKITWYKGNDLVQKKENIEISDSGNRLEFKYTTPEDDGIYFCNASNRAGSVSEHIKINLLGPKGVNIPLVVGLLALLVFLFAIIFYLFIRIRREQKLRMELTQAGLIHFEEGDVQNLNLNIGIEDQAELLPYDPKFEFPRKNLKLGKILGSGAFGVVYKAEAFGIMEGEDVTPVAVKMVKKNATDHSIIKALASELKIMIHLGRHVNVVNLLGAYTKSLNNMELLVIVEFCRYGNLHSYLMRHRKLFIDQIDPLTGLIDSNRGIEVLSQSQNGRPSSQSDSLRGDSVTDSRTNYRSQSTSSENFVTGATETTLVSMSPTGEDSFLMSNNSQPDFHSHYRGDFKGTVKPISTRDLLCYSFQVARGMEYLASRKVLHGDLAARNILLADNNIVKICDFGLSKTMYKDDNYLKKDKGLLPIKWMAIESIRDRIFSTQSDVWSFGVVLWEFFSLSRTPYPDMAADHHMYQKLEDGYRMDKPPYATDELYQVMLECWRAKPTLRPTFGDLQEKLGSLLEESVRQHYMDLNEPYMQMNAQWLSSGGRNDYLGMLNAPSYSNVVSSPHDDETEQPRYQNLPAPVNIDSTLPGYLTMKSPSPGDPQSIFSPTRPGEMNGGTVFKFHTPPQSRRALQDAEVNDHIELRPMLSGGSRQSDSTSGHDSDSDVNLRYSAVPSSRPVISDPHNVMSTVPLPSHSASFFNPSYLMAPDLVTSQDNYVNYPQQRVMNNNKPLDSITNVRTPTFSTFGRKSVTEPKLPNNYANLPSQR